MKAAGNSNEAAVRRLLDGDDDRRAPIIAIKAATKQRIESAARLWMKSFILEERGESPNALLLSGRRSRAAPAAG